MMGRFQLGESLVMSITSISFGFRIASWMSPSLVCQWKSSFSGYDWPPGPSLKSPVTRASGRPSPVSILSPCAM